MKIHLSLIIFIFSSVFIFAEDNFAPQLDWSQVALGYDENALPHGILVILCKINPANLPYRLTFFEMQFCKTDSSKISKLLPNRFSTTFADEFGSVWCEREIILPRSKFTDKGIPISFNITWGKMLKDNEGNGERGNKIGSFKKEIIIPWQPEFEYKDEDITLKSSIAWFKKPTNDNLIIPAQITTEDLQTQDKNTSREQ